MKMIFLFTLLSASAFAVTNEEIMNCFKPGAESVMHDFPVTDQDGLGTCYANTTSILLQKALGRTSPLSYQQIALSYADYQSPRIFAGSTRTGLTEGEEMATEGGFTCGAVEAVKNRGICSSENFPLEVRESSDALNKQAVMLRSFGGVVDLLNTFGKNMSEAQWANLTDNLTHLLAIRKETCALPPSERKTANISNQMTTSMLAMISDLEADIALGSVPSDGLTPKESRERTARLNDAREVLSSLKTVRERFMTETKDPKNQDISTWSIKPEAKAMIQESIPGYETQINAFETQTLKEREASLASIESPMAKIMKAAGPEFNTPIMKRIQEDPTFSDSLYSGLRSSNNCSENIDENVIAAFRERSTGDFPCPAPNLDDPAIRELNNEAKRIMAAIRSDDLGSMTSRSNGLIGVLAPRCADEMAATQAAVSALRCETFNASQFSLEGEGLPDFGNTKIYDPATPTPAARVDIAQKWAAYRLCDKRPVEISICADLLEKDGPVNTNFCHNIEKKNGKSVHGGHSMILTGYKVDSSGKMRFLVQNSWGRSCAFSNPTRAAGKNTECEMENGQPTGRFWIDAESIMNNTDSMSSIQPPTK